MAKTKAPFRDIPMHEEFTSCFNPMTDKEFDKLLERIDRYGQRTPALAWYNEDNVLGIVDGYHRYQACKELNIKLQFKTLKGWSREAVMELVMDNNQTRRSDTQSNDDKVKAVKAYTKANPGATDNQVAKATGVTNKTVAKHREDESPAKVKVEDDVAEAIKEFSKNSKIKSAYLNKLAKNPESGPLFELGLKDLPKGSMPMMKENMLDIRLFLENIGKLFANKIAVKIDNKKAVKEVVDKLPVLHKIDALYADADDDPDTALTALAMWEPKVEKVPNGKPLMWFGQNVYTETVADRLSYNRAKCVQTMFGSLLSQRFIDHGAGNPKPTVSQVKAFAVDLSNLAETLRCLVGGEAGNAVSGMVHKMAHDMRENPEAWDGHDFDSYFTTALRNDEI